MDSVEHLINRRNQEVEIFQFLKNHGFSTSRTRVSSLSLEKQKGNNFPSTIVEFSNLYIINQAIIDLYAFENYDDLSYEDEYDSQYNKFEIFQENYVFHGRILVGHSFWISFICNTVSNFIEFFMTITEIMETSLPILSGISYYHTMFIYHERKFKSIPSSILLSFPEDKIINSNGIGFLPIVIDGKIQFYIYDVLLNNKKEISVKTVSKKDKLDFLVKKGIKSNLFGDISLLKDDEHGDSLREKLFIFDLPDKYDSNLIQMRNGMVLTFKESNRIGLMI